MRFHAPSGLWRAHLPRAEDPAQHPEYFPTREAACAWLDGELARRARLAAGPDGDMALGAYLDTYLDVTSRSGDWSPGTVDSVECHFRYLDVLATRPLRSITRSDLQQVVARLVADGGVRRRKLSGSYIRLAVGYWRRAFAAAVDDELIARNPASRLVLPPADSSRRPSWTPAEARLLAGAIGGSLYEAVFALILGLGLRVGEALAVRWDEVDLARHRVRIRRTDDKRHGILNRTKGRTDDWMPLIPGVEAALRRQTERQTWEAVYVSEWRPGKRASWDVIRKHIKRLAEQVGVRALSPHAGRHAVGNLLGSAGIPLATIATRLRHRSPKTTADWYLATEDVGEEAASALLETLFNGKASGE